MLRWKTSSAICAVMLTACPLNSFAQQIVKPAPPEVSLLQPMGPIKIPGKVRKAAYAPLTPLARAQQAVAEYDVLQAPADVPAVEAPQPRTAALNPLVPMPPIQLRSNPTVSSQALNSRYRRPDGAPQQPVTTVASPLPPVTVATPPVTAATPQVRTFVAPQPQVTTAATPKPEVKRAASPKIIIRNPFVQPHNPNLYLFVVENVGTVDATNAAVDLYVPLDVTITNVVPASASSSAQRAHVNLANLKAGSKSIIEVEVSPTTNVVEFQTRLSLESVHVFSTAANPNYVVQAKPAAPVSTPIASTPIASTPIASQLNVALAPPTEVVSQIPLEPIAPPRNSVPATQVSQVKAPLLPLEPTAAAPGTATPTFASRGATEAAASPAAATTGRSGKAQPANIANAALNNANGVQAQLASARAVAAQASAEAHLSATVDGPVTLNANEEANFSITVTNPIPTEATGIIVQLTVPAGLKVTVLDRDAWFDQENQTISWEINQLASGQQETIQYKAVGQAIGQQNQKVTIGMQNVYQGKAQLVTLVSN